MTIASLNARQRVAGMSAYYAGTAGVVILTEVAALGQGSRGIRQGA